MIWSNNKILSLFFCFALYPFPTITRVAFASAKNKNILARVSIMWSQGICLCLGISCFLISFFFLWYQDFLRFASSDFLTDSLKFAFTTFFRVINSLKTIRYHLSVLSIVGYLIFNMLLSKVPKILHL